RDTLEDHGIDLNIDLTMDISSNFTGGISRGTVYRQLLQVGLEIDTERLFGWEGGTFFVNFANYVGKDGTDELVGDLQGFDEMDAFDFAAVTDLWYEQRLFEDRFRVVIGKADANEFFAFVESADFFLNSSAGF